MFKHIPVVLMAFFFLACDTKKTSHTFDEARVDEAFARGDTAYGKELLQREYDYNRSLVTDSSLTISMDISSKIISLEFLFNKKELLLNGDNTSSELIGEIKELYRLTRKLYSYGISISIRSSDRKYFIQKLFLSEDDWIKENFYDKSRNEALISLHAIQKDVLLTSLIGEGVDSDDQRAEVDRQYEAVDEILRTR